MSSAGLTMPWNLPMDQSSSTSTTTTITTTTPVPGEGSSKPFVAWHDASIKPRWSPTKTYSSFSQQQQQQHYHGSQLFVRKRNSGAGLAPSTQRLLVYVRAFSPQDAPSVRLRAVIPAPIVKHASSPSSSTSLTKTTTASPPDSSGYMDNYTRPQAAALAFNYIPSFRNERRQLLRGTRSMANLITSHSALPSSSDETAQPTKAELSPRLLLQTAWDEKHTVVHHKLTISTSATATPGSTESSSVSDYADEEDDADFSLLSISSVPSLLSDVDDEGEEDDESVATVHEYDPATMPQPLSLAGEVSELSWEWNGDLCDDSSEKKRIRQKREINKQRRDMVEYVKALRRERRRSLQTEEGEADVTATSIDL